MGCGTSIDSSQAKKKFRAQIRAARVLLQERKKQLEIRKRELCWKLGFCQKQGIIEAIGITGAIEQMYVAKTKACIQVANILGISKNLKRLQRNIPRGLGPTSLKRIDDLLKMATIDRDFNILHSVVQVLRTRFKSELPLQHCGTPDHTTLEKVSQILGNIGRPITVVPASSRI